MKNKISDYIYTNKCKFNNLYTVGVFIALGLLFQSCEDKNGEVNFPWEPGDKTKPNVSLNFSDFEEKIVDNLLIYVFQKSNDHFKGPQMNIQNNENFIQFPVEEGNWNFVLVSADTDISDKIISPQYNTDKSLCKMWEMSIREESPGVQFLNQTPEELRYAAINDVVITEGVNVNRTAAMNRNVAKIQVVLKNHTGFDLMPDGLANNAYIELHNVPKSLSWDGKLYPSKESPDISPVPMREYMNFTNQEADTLTFIVPAHRGSDAFTTNPQDTTQSQLRLKACMPLNGAPFYGKGEVVISHVPKPNRILIIDLTFRGEPDTDLDVKVMVKDWQPFFDQEEIFD